MLATAHRPGRWVCLGLVLASTACGEAPPPPDSTPAVPAPAAAKIDAPVETRPAEPERAPRDVFWSRLSALCGNAYAGYLTIGTEDSDRSFGEADLKVHVKDCGDDEIRIPFHVGDDRSRTFVLRRGADALTLHHRHLDENGDSAEPDGYGGATRDPGTERRQEFVVDEATRSSLPQTRYNVWAIEVVPGKLFAYELQRPEEDRFFRVEFELAEPIPTPPPPWGEG